MSSGDRPRPGSHRRLLSAWLWILAALLGGASIAAAGSIIHDNYRRQSAAHVVARATAEQVAAIASERLTIAALGRPTLPSFSAHFRFDLPTHHLALTFRDSVRDNARVLTEVVTEQSLAAATAPRRSADATLAVHAATGDARLPGQAVVTAVDYDTSGAPTSVTGIVTDARALASLIFGGLITEKPVVKSALGLARLDSASLEVQTADGTPIFGKIGAGDRFIATVSPIGPLEGMRVTVGVLAQQIPAALAANVPRQELWHLGLLVVATFFVIIAAASGARRELALARARSDFIAGVSHDLRMPLAQILLAGETLSMQRERDAGERRRLATSIVREAQRLIALVENVLLFSRSGAVEFTPQLRPVSVDELFVEVLDGVQLAVDDAGQHIDFETTRLAVLGDRQLLRQALVNLVDNAIKYGGRGAHIRLGAVAQSDDAACLFVDDDGPGIPVEDRARVFDAYERLARDQSSERTGSGLGLAVVRHIARACGGNAWLEDAQPRGTRGVIQLQRATLPCPVPSGVA